jgi:hypothetical protein
MAITVNTDAKHFKEDLFEKAPKTYREESVNGKLSQ